MCFMIPHKQSYLHTFRMMNSTSTSGGVNDKYKYELTYQRLMPTKQRQVPQKEVSWEAEISSH